MKCKTCHHPQSQAIDLALLARTHTLEALSAVYGLTISSLFRHKKHLKEKLRRSRQRLQDIQSFGSLLKLKATLDEVIQNAKAAGDIDRVVKSVRAGSRIVLRMSQIDLPLDREALYRLISNRHPETGSDTLPRHMRDVSAKKARKTTAGH